MLMFPHITEKIIARTLTMLLYTRYSSAGLIQVERNDRGRFSSTGVVKSDDNTARYSTTQLTHQLLRREYIIAVVVVHNRICRHPDYVGLQTVA
jgi:hypothetical protein